MENSFVFLSYSRVDGQEHAFTLANKLRQHGFDVWMDQSNLEPGKIWGTAIGEALLKCRCLIFIATSKSVVSTNVVNEIDYALDNKKKVIPVVFEDCNMPFRIHALQRIDFTKNYDDSFARLINAVDDTALTNIPASRRSNKLPFILGGSLLVVVVAFIIYWYQNMDLKTVDKSDSSQRESTLRNIGGTVNQAVVYDRYEDAVPYMAPEIRSVITKQVFNAAVDSVSYYVGRFLHPIDTAYRKANGNEVVVIRNQFEKGIAITQMMFLNEGTLIFGLFTQPYRNQ